MKRPDPRALAFLSGVPGRGPETLHVDLTNACNFNCIYCWHYSPLRDQPPTRNWRTQRLPTVLALAAIEDAAALGTPRVLFSGGGEPLLHPDAYRILERCTALGLKTTLISNLSVADLERLRQHPPEKILANCSAATEATYLSTHPNRRVGDWDHFITRARELSAVSEVTLVYVVTRHNVHELRAVLPLAADVGARRVQFKLADLHGALATASISAAERAACLDALPDLRTDAERLGLATTLDAFARELHGARQDLDFVQQGGCYVGWYYARIAADGSVFACCKNVPIGHLAQASFAEIWRGESYHAFRARTRARDFSAWPGACAACGNLSLNVRAAQLVERAARASRSST